MNKIIKQNSEFEDAVSDFQLYKPVNIANGLEDEFANAITKHMIANNVMIHSYVRIPLVKFYKFKRKS